MTDQRRAAGGVRASFTQRALIAVQNRRVFPYLVVVMAVSCLVTGLLAHLIDRKDFPTFGVGVWWAVVTLGTVGYGDVVPHTAWGRVLGSVVIVVGVTFIAFVIAILTSLLIDAHRESHEDELQARHDELLGLMRGLDARLEAIEQRSSAQPGTLR